MSSLPSPQERIIRPEPAALRSVWPSEPADFTPWLAANLDWLDVLDLGPLELVGTEMTLPEVRRSLDILAQTPTGTRVAIENQYQQTDHDHLTRGLAYAVGHEAKALVVISEAHGREFVAIADYLNTAYEALGVEHGIAVFLVTLSVSKVGDHYVPGFSVVSRPNTWLADIHADNEGGVRSVEAFLAQCPAGFRDSAQQILRSWVSHPSGSVRINPKSTSISLDYPYSPSTGHQSVYVLYADGTLTVNRGYLRESVITDALTPELDQRMRDSFPGVSDKPYYPTVRNPDPDGVARFADWVIAVGTGMPQDAHSG